MKITAVEAIELRLPEELIGERADDGQNVLIVQVHTDEGLVGVGEVVSQPRVAKAVIEAPRAQDRFSGLACELIGMDPLQTSVVWERLSRATYYYGRRGVVVHAMAGVDMALWDLKGKYYGVPVHALLGGAFTTRVRAYASDLFGVDAEETEAKARRWREAGYTAVKLGWAPMGQSERLDLELVAALRRGAGLDLDIMVDAGCCWDAATALRRARQFQEFDILWLEEPLAQDDLDGYRRLCDASPVPIAAGEGEAERNGFRDLIERGGIDVCQIDLARTGFTEGVRIADMAEDRGRRVVNHFYSTGVNLAAGLHFAASRKSTFILEYSVDDTQTRWGVTRQKMSIDADGYVAVPEGPGLGIDLDEDTIDDLRVS